MNKDTHIHLAHYLIDNLEEGRLIRHKKAFCFGSILPDCVPSFLIRKHNAVEAFDELRGQILKITDDYHEDGITAYYCRHLGVVTHYVADFFTYPHNPEFQGSLKAHCNHESQLAMAFEHYLNGCYFDQMNAEKLYFKDANEICDYIKVMHREYQSRQHHIGVDCSYILELCAKIVGVILRLFELKIMKKEAVRVQAA